MDFDVVVGVAGVLREKVGGWAQVRTSYPWVVGDCGSAVVAGEIESMNDWYAMTWNQLESGVVGLADAAVSAAAAYAASEEVVESVFSSPEYVL